MSDPSELAGSLMPDYIREYLAYVRGEPCPHEERLAKWTAVIVAAREIDACLGAPDPNDPTKLLVAKGKGEQFVNAAKQLRAALLVEAAINVRDS